MKVIFLSWHGKWNIPTNLRHGGLILDEEERIDIDAVVGILEEKGPHLPYPYSSDVKGTRYGSIRELRIQHKGKPYRILYAFDPRRTAILLIGGRKAGGHRWYENYVPLAERIYEKHLKTLKNEQGGA